MKNTEDNICNQVALDTWEDSVAYAVGLNYAVETKTGYSVPIDEVIKNRYFLNSKMNMTHLRFRLFLKRVR